MDYCFHLSLGCCQYADFKSGDLVELSNWGWNAGLAINYAYTFGRVTKFDGSVLTVLREGAEYPQEFHPCFWISATKEEIDELREHQHKWHWRDHVPDRIDDFQFNE